MNRRALTRIATSVAALCLLAAFTTARPADTAAGSELTVNVFNGNEHSEVHYRIGGGEWIAMERLDAAPSPFFERLREVHEGTFDEWMTPVPTNHIWRATLPELGAGVHRVTLRTVDMYGQRFEKHSVIEVE